jgi:DNA-binding response OmpR family regulator
LDAGADDYLTKPFDIPELIARLRAITRRLGGRTANTLNAGDVTLDVDAHTVLLAGEPIELSGREYALLQTFMENSARLLTREQLERALYAWGDEVTSNTIEVHIHSLRKKLGKSFIKTVRGIGYGVGVK